jgi:hypothetical protein
VLKEVAGLASKCVTQWLKGGEPDGARLAGLEDGEVGPRDADAVSQFRESQLPGVEEWSSFTTMGMSHRSG